MEFKNYLTEHAQKHPSCEPRDVVKLCYQAARGAEHMFANLEDLDAAAAYFFREFDGVEPRDGELFERISDKYCRVDLGAWKKTGMPREWLLTMFTLSGYREEDGEKTLERYLADARACVCDGRFAFSVEQWDKYLEFYRILGMPSVHHSEAYRTQEKPAYRLVRSSYCALLPLLQKIHAVREEKVGHGRPMVIAIDGRAGSGKTTLSRNLRRIIGEFRGGVQMDDFFLPADLRTESRLAEAGGNVHYERFAEEVVPYIAGKESFSYRYFDCMTMDYEGSQQVVSEKWRVVEGSYSHHPYFGDYADLKVFVDVDPELQMERIKDRDGSMMAERFRTQWIPMEERYFDAFHIRERADVVMEYRIFELDE